MDKVINIIIWFVFICSCTAKNIIDERSGQLYQAAKQGDYQKVQVLIKEGADVNYKKQFLSNDDYPLNAAIGSGNIEIVKYFISIGAKIDTENDNRFCLSDAIHKKDKKIIKYLLRQGVYVDKSCKSQLIFSALYSCSFEMLKFVIEELGVCVNSREIHYENTPIYKTICEDLFQEAAYLIKKGADVNIPNKKKETPLHAAVMAGRIKMIELLLKNGADVTIKDEKGLTPLDYAKQSNNQPIIKLLMRYGK